MKKKQDKLSQKNTKSTNLWSDLTTEEQAVVSGGWISLNLQLGCINTAVHNVMPGH